MKSRVATASFALLLLAGCPEGQSGATRRITHRRTASVPSRPAIAGSTDAQRFAAPTFVPPRADDGALAPPSEQGGCCRRKDAPEEGSPSASPSPALEEIPQADAPSLQWDAPATWVRQGEKPMRLVTFAVGKQTECYVSVLGGDGGGLAANYDRWRGQVGEAPLGAAALAALPRIKVLGQDAALLLALGEYHGMADGDPRAGFALLGIACREGGQTVFVKMIGPEAEVLAERDRFAAFCGSLR